MDIDIRPIVQDEFPAYLRATARAFGGHALDEYIERYAKVFIPGRWGGAFQGSDLVGGASSVPSSIGVEGAALPVAAVEDVTVLPTHTRRGIMTRMMDHQLRDLHERGEPIAALWASESIIYGRFGYGVGCFHEQWKISRPHTGIPASNRQPRRRGVRYPPAKRLRCSPMSSVELSRAGRHQ